MVQATSSPDTTEDVGTEATPGARRDGASPDAAGLGRARAAAYVVPSMVLIVL
ncbi:MAG: hypothetical protein HOV76_31920, partial [Hamadaea sp.]|nr:hypothetical protein [Hamadaea sp.]